MTTIWVDVSHHDWNRRGGNLDWPAVRAATSPVMCARATYGDPAGFAPPTYHFGDFQQGAAAAGFELRGGYHNLVRGDAASMRRQVEWFRRELGTHACDWAMLDVERYKELVERDLWPRWEDVLRFRDAWHAVDDRALAYYVPRWLLTGYYGDVDLAQLPGPWVQSHYLSGIYGSPWQIYTAGGGDAGTGWDDWWGGRYPDIWQYSATCDVAGASSQTDVNAFRGSIGELRALLTGDDMDTETKIHAHNADSAAYSWATMSENVTLVGVNDPIPGKGVYPHEGVKMIKAIAANVASLTTRPPIQLDPAVLAAAVREALREALTDPGILRAIAVAVADEDHRRSAE